MSSTISTSHVSSTSTTISYTASSIPIAKDNPFLETTKFKQGTLYVIIFPIIGGFLLLYILISLINKCKSNKLAKHIDSFDKDYEFNDYNNNLDHKNSLQSSNDYDNYLNDNPFSDRYETSNKSFTHKKNLSSVDFISQYRRSMDRLSGMDLKTNINNGNDDNDNDNNGKEHSRDKNKSMGSVLQLNLNQTLSNLQLNTNSNSNTNSDPDTVYYSMVGTDNTNSILNPPEIIDISDKNSFYSIVEPSKTVSNSTINIPNNKTRFHHHRKLSSMALDDFISTGELPILNQQPRTIDDVNFENGNLNNNNNNNNSNNLIMQNPNHNTSVESHSMFEDNSFNNSYNIPDTNSNVKHSVIRSPSPIRNGRIYNQNLSRSPTRSPTRSPIRSPIRSNLPIV